MQRIIIEISPRGKTKIEADGFAGPGCQSVLDNLVSSLGKKTVDSCETKPEFYMTQSSSNTITTTY